MHRAADSNVQKNTARCVVRAERGDRVGRWWKSPPPGGDLWFSKASRRDFHGGMHLLTRGLGAEECGLGDDVFGRHFEGGAQTLRRRWHAAGMSHSRARGPEVCFSCVTHPCEAGEAPATLPYSSLRSDPCFAAGQRGKHIRGPFIPHRTCSLFRCTEPSNVLAAYLLAWGPF